jgi:hypothetical protein
MTDKYAELRAALDAVEFHDDGHTKRQIYGPKEWELAANPEAIRALLAERDAQAAEIARLRMAAQAADDALTMYERYGEICPFEGEPMIHAATLIALGDLARAALTQQEQGK